MNKALSVVLAAACLLGAQGCSGVGNSAKKVGRKVDRAADDLGRERDVRFMGKDVIVHPEADEKIRINF